MGLLTAEVEQLLQAARLHLAKDELHEAVGQATEVIATCGFIGMIIGAALVSH
jgi:Asp-tRNA(Asn)/Glu-tRNA(Gln) amidotransferase C subunit